MADELPQWKRPPKRRQRRGRLPVEVFAAIPRSARPAREPLPAVLRAQIAARFALLQASRPLTGLRLALRLAGLHSAARRGAWGSSAFGWWLHGHRGGNAVRAHRYRRGSAGSIPGYPTLRPWLKTPKAEP